jgi:hypothetical protein
MPCQINNNSNYDTTEIEDLIQDLFSFSQNRFGFQDSPVLNLVSDKKNTSPLGKTAHYDPNSMEITIYVDGRHPKDIMRSFSHELVHHNQNENGEFANVVGQGGSNYAQTNPHLRKMEKEAYLKGNMCFRDWEDGYKSSNPNILNERRIYKMSIKDWKNKELSSLLNERWGFSMDLNKLNESKKITHMCALEVTHKKSGKKGHPIKHTLTESGHISHYTVEFEDVIVENISVDNLNILVQEKHTHKRDDEKEHDKKKKIVSEEELENKEKADLDKDGKLSGYEKKRGKAIEKSMKGQKNKKAKKGEVPAGLKKHQEKQKKKQVMKEQEEDEFANLKGKELTEIPSFLEQMRKAINNSGILPGEATDEEMQKLLNAMIPLLSSQPYREPAIRMLQDFEVKPSIDPTPSSRKDDPDQGGSQGGATDFNESRKRRTKRKK